MSDETFSFRWGILLLDGGYTDVPNFMLDNYAQAGVSRPEFLTIVHLARYQFESRASECRPSVATVAQQMGYSARGLQKILAGLVERGLLARRPRRGKTTVYDFSGFSRAVLKLSTGVNPSSPEEEKVRRKEEEEEKNGATAPCGRVMLEGVRCLGDGSEICDGCDLLIEAEEVL